MQTQTPKFPPALAERLAPLTDRIDLLLARQACVSVALEGPAAAGKTLAAAFLAARYDCRVVHMDDFFLPLPLRTPERFAEPGGNIHYERFAEQVLPALQSGAALCYPAFDCSVMAEGAPRRLPPRPLTVVEGVYSLHPLFRAAYDLRVFLRVDPACQRARILARDGAEKLARYTEQWIPLEARYFAACNPEGCADLVL